MNSFLETRRDDDVSGQVSTPIAAANVTRTLRHRRQCMAPIRRGSGVLAEWESAGSSNDRHHRRTAECPHVTNLLPTASSSYDWPVRIVLARRGRRLLLTRASLLPRRSSRQHRESASDPSIALSVETARASLPSANAASITTGSSRVLCRLCSASFGRSSVEARVDARAPYSS